VACGPPSEDGPDVTSITASDETQGGDVSSSGSTPGSTDDGTSSETSSAATTSVDTSSGSSTTGAGDTDGCVQPCGAVLGATQCDDARIPPGVDDGTCGGTPMLVGDWQCALAMFASGEPGRLDIGVKTAPGQIEVPCSYYDRIYMLGDGTAIYERELNDRAPVLRVEVRPPEYFEACLASEDPEVVAPCFTDWFAAEYCVQLECCPSDGDCP
jgi:hypothetical protein